MESGAGIKETNNVQRSGDTQDWRLECQQSNGEGSNLVLNNQTLSSLHIITLRQFEFHRHHTAKKIGSFCISEQFSDDLLTKK